MIWLTAALAALAVLTSGGITAQERPPVRVTVYQTVASGRATYHYAVTNNDDRPITQVRIGVDPMDRELTLPRPLGWTRDGETPRTIEAPAGWSADVVRTEETLDFRVDWVVRDGPGIAPGHTLAGFDMTVAKPEDVYSSTGWEAVDDLTGVMSGVLEPRSSRRPVRQP